MFHFRLQSVLDVRERMARLKQKEFAEVLARHQLLEAEIERHEAELARAARYVDNLRRTSPTVVPLELFGNFQRRVKGDMERIQEQMREQAQELEAKRSALVEAKRAQRSLEILRDKARARYEDAMGRRERVAMDEVASNYFLLRQTERRGEPTDHSADG
ncbi:MAG TPA: flagellar export protein FliJ [bacterium]|nr:flagellar export protein FliJ [bacterium]